MKAILLNGSPRKNFSTAQLLQQAQLGAEAAEKQQNGRGVRCPGQHPARAQKDLGRRRGHRGKSRLFQLS